MIIYRIIYNKGANNISNFIEINLLLKDSYNFLISIIACDILKYKENFIVLLIYSNKVYINS